MKKEITIVDNVLFAEFKKECRLILLAKEYPGYVGYEKYLILTDLSKEKLIIKYGVLLKNYEPYLIDSMRLYSPIANYDRNEGKYEKRNLRNTVSIEVNSDDERTIGCLQVEDVFPSLIEESGSNTTRLVHRALKTLTDTEKRRLIMWAIRKMTEEEIAKKEGASQQAISKSLDKARKKFEVYFL